jgi:hypothetical protein
MTGYRGPGPRDFEFRHIVQIVNRTTGALVDVDIDIHRDDIDWLINLWQDSFALDWEIQRAEQEAAAVTPCGTWP